MSILKKTISSYVLAANKMLGARLLVTDETGDVESYSGLKYVKPKTRRLKNQKLAKTQKLSKLEKSKKLSKNRNSLYFNAIKVGPSFKPLTASLHQRSNFLTF